MTLQLMVTMMETMKEMQKKTTEEREDSGMLRGVELVRAGVADLPALPPWSPTTGPLQLGDWMLLITPVIADLSLTSEEWWSLMTKESEKWFQAHMALGPIDRLQHAPAVPVQLQEDRWQRLERRVSTMILQALPEGVREELASARRLSVLVSSRTSCWFTVQVGFKKNRSCCETWKNLEKFKAWPKPQRQFGAGCARGSAQKKLERFLLTPQSCSRDCHLNSCKNSLALLPIPLLRSSSSLINSRASWRRICGQPLT